MRFARLAVLPALVLATPGCGDDVPPTPKGAFVVSLNHQSTDCAIQSHNTTVGSVTNTSKQTLLQSGEEGAEVSCSVTGSGAFNVSGSILQGGKFLQISVGGLKTSATVDAPEHGSVGYASTANITAGTYGTKETACNFYFTDAPPQGVAAGRVWVAFDCPAVFNDQSSCELKTSYVIFENCSKGDEEE